jgi:DNA polymerase II small subunit/DNA polymerase delta subunit B
VVVVYLKQLNSRYEGKYKSVYLLFIGDTHLGNKYFNKKYLDEALLFAKRNRDRTRILLMGDVIEAATKTSVGRQCQTG